MEMRSKRSLSGCLIWIIAFLLVSGCLVPVSLFVSGMSTFFSEDLIAPTLGPYLCPDNTNAEIITYDSTIIDQDGFTRASTSYEMICKSPDGITVENLGGSYALIWSGIFVVVSVLLAAVLSVVLTLIILRLFRNKTPQTSQTPPLVKIQ